MSCCGNKREKYKQASGSFARKQDKTKAPATMWADVYFEYTGETALTVKGNVTGKSYRFNHPGEVLLVDYRDASGMRGVTVLTPRSEIV